MATKQDRRQRNIERLEQTGITDKKAIRRMRDWSNDRINEAIKDFTTKGDLPAYNPSDIPQRTPIRDPIREPTKRPPPPPAERPNGQVVVFWKDITKRGRKSRYPDMLKELKSMKAAMRKQDPDAIRAYIKEMLKADEGKIGDLEIRLYDTDQQLKDLKKEYRGWQVIYNGKGRSKKDLLIGLAAVVTGIYNLALTRAAAEFFISQIKKIHPTNGQWLDEVYRNL